MKLPRVRFTVRRMMVAVAVAAMTLAPVAYLERRRERFTSLAAFHASQVVGYEIDGSGWRPVFIGRDGRPVSHQKGERDLWHSRLKQKYEEAALRPWAPVLPDPPESDWTVVYSDVPLLPRKPPTIREELRRQASRTRAMRELKRQSHYGRWLEEEKRRLPY
jgi:hypothetical protein